MDELEQIIINRLEEMNIDYNSLKPSIKDYLKKIEEIISTEMQVQKAAIISLKKNKVNISSIAEELNLSRTTFYNNTELKAYIEHSEKILDENNPVNAYNELRASTSLLQTQVNKMIERDVNSEIIKNENKVLKNTIKDKNKEIIRLQNRNAELSSELHKKKANSSSKKLRN